MLHGLQPADHRLDPSANLLVLLQQLGALGGQRILAAAQRTVLVLEVLHRENQFVEALLKTAHFKLELGFCRCLAHTANIGSGDGSGQRRTHRRGAHGGRIPAMPTDRYAQLEQVLAGALRGRAPAETHGILCGALCARPGYGMEDWLAEVADGGAHSGELRRALGAEYARTVADLSDAQFEFTPLLPDDDVLLEERVVALAEWCGGFLYGLGTGSLPGLDRADSAVGEIIRDFSEISRAHVEGPEADEGGETAYAELVEYVRAGTVLVFEELEDVRERARPSGGGVH